MRFFLEETLVHRQLPNVQQSVLDYFVFTVRCPRQRRALLRFAWEHFRPRRKFVWAPHDKLQRRALRSPPRPPSPVAPSEAQGEESPGDAFLQSGACGPGTSQGGDSVAASPQLPSSEPQEKSVEDRDQGEEAENQGEEGLEPSSPKESKKRKLEASRREQAPGEAGPQGASEVEKIARNLEDCALSQGGLGAGTQEMGSQEPGETEQACPPPPGAKVANDEVRKRRKVDQSLAPTWPPAQPGPPEAGMGENGVEEESVVEDQGHSPPEQDAPQSSAAEEPAVDQKAESAEAGLAAKPRTP